MPLESSASGISGSPRRRFPTPTAFSSPLRFPIRMHRLLLAPLLLGRTAHGQLPRPVARPQRDLCGRGSTRRNCSRVRPKHSSAKTVPGHSLPTSLTTACITLCMRPQDTSSVSSSSNPSGACMQPFLRPLTMEWARSWRPVRELGLSRDTFVFFSADNGATREVRAGLRQQPARAGDNAPFRVEISSVASTGACIRPRS